MAAVAKEVSAALGLGALTTLPRDGWILFTTRAVRMFAFGGVGLILALYFNALGLPDDRIGLLLFLTLIGDAIISLLVTVTADGIGRRRMLALGCFLKLFGAVAYAGSRDGTHFWLLAAAGALAVISPSGNEVGPFLALEQSVLSDQVIPSERTMVFAWYNVLGYLATAFGSVTVGVVCTHLTLNIHISSLDAYRLVFVGYGVCAILLLILVLCLTHNVELHKAAAPQNVELAASKSGLGTDEEAGEDEDEHQSKPLLQEHHADSAQVRAQAAKPGQTGSGASTTADVSAARRRFMGLTAKSQGLLLRLSLLFATDSFAGTLVTGTLLAYYFKIRFGVNDAYLGGILFVSNIIAGVSSLLSGWVAKKCGLVNTMVFTHLPSNILTMLVPAMPNLGLATSMVFLRFCLSQMDVVPRQSFVSGIVPADERTATMGIVNVVKSLAGACGPLLTGWLALQQQFDLAFYLCGGIKVCYDIALLWSFHSLKADHERS